MVKPTKLPTKASLKWIDLKYILKWYYINSAKPAFITAFIGRDAFHFATGDVWIAWKRRELRIRGRTLDSEDAWDFLTRWIPEETHQVDICGPWSIQSSSDFTSGNYLFPMSVYVARLSFLCYTLDPRVGAWLRQYWPQWSAQRWPHHAFPVRSYATHEQVACPAQTFILQMTQHSAGHRWQSHAQVRKRMHMYWKMTMCQVFHAALSVK